ARAPIVRVLGLDGAFAARSYKPGETATLVLAAEADAVTVQLLHVGPETEPTYANNELKGIAVTQPIAVPWAANADQPAPISLPIGNWPSGLYTAKIATADGRLGFAPVVVRPTAPVTRVAVCLPTNTWQAYNFYDGDGDGYGDSWYVSWAIGRID